jgi:hypothetical protein
LEMYWFPLVGLCRQNTKREKGRNAIYWNSTSTASSFPFHSCLYFIHCFIGSRIFSHSSWNLVMKGCTVNNLTKMKPRLSQHWWKGWYQNLNNLRKLWVCKIGMFPVCNVARITDKIVFKKLLQAYTVPVCLCSNLNCSPCTSHHQAKMKSSLLVIR